jgi:hypothetical protein
MIHLIQGKLYKEGNLVLIQVQSGRLLSEVHTGSSYVKRFVMTSPHYAAPAPPVIKRPAFSFERRFAAAVTMDCNRMQKAL